MVRLPLREDTVADGEVETVGIEIVQKLRGIDIVQPQMDIGRDLAKIGEEGGGKQNFHAVRQTDPEQPLGRPGVERLVRGHERLDPGEDDPYRVDKGKGAGRGTHALRLRVRISSPNSARRRARLWLMADCPRPTRAAARVTLRSVSKASRATSRFRSKRPRLMWSMIIIDPICWINNDSRIILLSNGSHIPQVRHRTLGDHHDHP